tara:strand:- start:17307 stop:17813 length:507 start_codon:yes stop_codon:yes gene_type:complete
VKKETLSEIFSFPEVVNEYAARLVAFLVLCLSILIIKTENIWLLSFLTYGFWARVLTGPTLSPLGLIVTKGIIPAFGNPSKSVIGPPKRFAQAIGVVFSTTALAIAIMGNWSISINIILVLAIFASLESLFGFCAGCWVFGHLIRLRIIPEKFCAKCQNLEFSLSQKS